MISQNYYKNSGILLKNNQAFLFASIVMAVFLLQELIMLG